MITAHLPSGYVLGASTGLAELAFFAALAGAVFPDVDLIWFYFVDDRAFHHHRYWVHAPVFAAGCGVVLILLAVALAPKWKLAAIAFSAAWLLHILLDSVVGEIMWLWPYSTQLYSLFTVPGREGVHFIVAFLTHWTILFEGLVWTAAAVLWMRRRRG